MYSSACSTALHGVFILVNTMNAKWRKLLREKDRSLFIEDNFKANAISIAKRGLVYGVGSNDAGYCTQPCIDGKQVRCKAYQDWQRMIERCYSSRYLHANTTYIGVTVCDEWRSFSAFRNWWLDNYVDGWQLDKDILSDMRTYSPETCLYVPSWLNSFITDHGAASGEWPIGVCYDKRRGKYRASCSNKIEKKLEHLGYFDTAAEANRAWAIRKLQIALALKSQMDGIDMRIYPRIVDIIMSKK